MQSLTMSSLWAEHVLTYTPVDNLVFMEELQSQHHTGRIEAAEMHKIAQPGSSGTKVPDPGGPKAVQEEGLRVEGRRWGGEARPQVVCRRGVVLGWTHTARGSENTSL